MRNLVDYLIVTALGLGVAFMVIHPIVERVAQSMDDSANMIAQSTSHQGGNQ